MMARIAVEDVELHGCPVRAGDRVLLNFAAANRDPDMFSDAQLRAARRGRQRRQLRRRLSAVTADKTKALGFPRSG
jgi:cytochrome P450